jgi:hypothetical protein
LRCYKPVVGGVTCRRRDCRRRWPMRATSQRPATRGTDDIAWSNRHNAGKSLKPRTPPSVASAACINATTIVLHLLVTALHNMSRAKPYTRNAKGDPDSQWSHDLARVPHDAGRQIKRSQRRKLVQGALRLGQVVLVPARPPRLVLGRPRAPPSSPLVGGSSSSKLHGFTSNAPLSANAGKAPRPTAARRARA